MKVIIDTDIGDDIDDLFAIILALNSPELDIKAITTVGGNVLSKSKIVKKVLKLKGKEEIQIGTGSDKTISGNPMKPGTEEEYLENGETDTESFSNAIDVIISKIFEEPKEFSIITIGPLTNIALAMKKEPKIIQSIKEMVCMCGAFGRRETNFNTDIEATKTVFNSGIPITMVGLDVTLKVWLEEKYIERIKKMDTPILKFATKMLNLWLKRIKMKKTPMHDPLTISVCINRNMVKIEKMRITFEEKDGEIVPMRSINEGYFVDVCVDVDSSSFMDFFIERLLRDGCLRSDSKSEDLHYD